MLDKRIMRDGKWIEVTPMPELRYQMKRDNLGELLPVLQQKYVTQDGEEIWREIPREWDLA